MIRFTLLVGFIIIAILLNLENAESDPIDDLLLNLENRAADPKNGACRVGWEMFQWKCFLFVRENATWGEAAAICREHGGRLARIYSATEHKFVYEKLNHLHPGAHLQSNYIIYWLGATDLEKEDRWKWAGTEMFPYIKWGRSQPDQGSSGNCLCLWNRENFPFGDAECNRKSYFICEEYVH